MKIAVIISFVLFSGFHAVGQVIKPPVAPPASRQKTAVAVTEIPGSEWKSIISNMDKEDWDRASELISQAMLKLTFENDKKQLAQLRYFYVYSLAGKASQKRLTPAALEKAVSALADKEFLFPARTVLADCKRSLNSICAVKDTDSVLRTTATNRSNSAIHIFEYVELPNPFNIYAHNGQKAFLTGYLRKAEFNKDASAPWVMRLYFSGGMVRLISPS